VNVSKPLQQNIEEAQKPADEREGSLSETNNEHVERQQSFLEDVCGRVESWLTGVVHRELL
jgi:hypothetical protein